MLFRLSFLLISLLLAFRLTYAQQNEIDSLKKLLTKVDLPNAERIVVLNELCWNNRDKNFKEAMQYGKEAQKIANEIGDYYGEAKSFNFTGVVYRNMGDYARAMQDFFEALDIAERNNLKEQLGYAYNNVGDIYKSLKQYPESLEYCNKAVEVFNELNNLQGMAYGYIRIGEVYQEQQQLDSAIIIFKKSLEIREELGSLNQISSSLDRIGEIYHAKEQFQEALDFYNQSLKIAQQLNNLLRISDTKWSIGRIYLAQGKLEKAKQYVHECLEIAKKVEAKDFIAKASFTMAEIYGEQKLYEKAFEFQTLHAKVNSELIDREIRSQVKGLESQYDLQKAQSELQIKQQNEKINKILIFGLSSLVALVLIIIILLLKNRKRNVEINRKLQSQNNELENLNKFRNKILSVISHDTRGPIHSISSIIKLFKKEAISVDESKLLFKQLEDRLRQVNMLLDNILAWSKSNFDNTQEEVIPEKIDLLNTVQKIAHLFSYNIGEKQILLELELGNHYLFVDKNMLNIIIRNLVANAIKFTKKQGKIKIYTKESDHSITTYIEDDGVGIPESRIKTLFTEQVVSTEGSDLEIGTGLGLMLCRQYVELNKGEIGVESEEGKGSKFWFELPLYRD